MLKRYLSMLVVVMMALTFVPSKAEAVWAVVDVKSIKQIADQWKELSKQWQELKERWDFQHRFLDKILADANRNLIGINLKEMSENISHPKKGVTLEHLLLEQAWAQYEVGEITRADKKTSLHDSAVEIKKLANSTKVATEMANQALMAINEIERIGGDNDRLLLLMDASTGAPNELTAIQAGNQIAALQTQQMIRLQYLIARNQHMQITQQAQNIVREELATEQNHRFYNRIIGTETKVQMVGTRLPGLQDW